MKNLSKIVDYVNLADGDFTVISDDEIQFISEANEDEIKEIVAEIKNTSNVIPKEKIELGPSIAIMPTLDCNFRCIYCYSNGGDNKKNLSFDNVKKALNFIAERSTNPKRKILTIYFVGGGEPFLGFDCMRNSVNYAKRLFENVEIVLVCNGSFNTEQFNWIVENKAIVRVSYDGLDQREQRPAVNKLNSQPIVQKNIERLVRTGILTTVQMTVTQKNISKMIDSVSHIASLGVKFVKIEPVHDSIISRSEKNMVPKIDDFIENLVKTIYFIINNGLDIKIDNSFLSRPTSGYYCGAGGGENFTLTPEGFITSCLEITNTNQPFAEEIIFGKVNDDGLEIFKEKREILDKLHFSNYENCPKCNLKLICGGGCPMQAAWDNRNLFHPSEYGCQIHKKLLPKLFKMICSDNKVIDILFDNQSVIKC